MFPKMPIPLSQAATNLRQLSLNIRNLPTGMSAGEWSQIRRVSGAETTQAHQSKGVCI